MFISSEPQAITAAFSPKDRLMPQSCVAAQKCTNMQAALTQPSPIPKRVVATSVPVDETGLALTISAKNYG